MVQSQQRWIGTGTARNGVPVKILATEAAFWSRYRRVSIVLYFVSHYSLQLFAVNFSLNLQYNRNRPMDRR